MKTKYSAPALSKGLMILEFMASQKKPLTLQSLSHKIGMSISQIYRIVQVLQTSGYLIKDLDSDSYILSPKLFLLGMNFRDNCTLLDLVMPLLEQISAKTYQSCHFVIQTDKNISVIARSHPDVSIGFSVKIGHTCAMQKASSSMLILAFLPKEEQQRVLSKSRWRDYHKTFQQIKKRQLYLARSYYTRDIIDISIPLFSSYRQKIIGAITLSYMDILGNPLSFREIVRFLKTKSPCYIAY